MESDFRSRLLAAAGVTALVGNRVDWVERPQGKPLPAITLQIVTDSRAQNFDGFDEAQPGHIQVDGWAETHAQASALKEAIIAALVPDAVQGSTRFSRAFVSSRDLPERTEGKTIHRPSMDFTFYYSPA